jgi:hypothetical protein
MGRGGGALGRHRPISPSTNLGRETTFPTSPSWTSHLQNQEKMYIWCLNHSISRFAAIALATQQEHGCPSSAICSESCTIDGHTRCSKEPLYVGTMTHSAEPWVRAPALSLTSWSEISGLYCILASCSSFSSS